MRQSPEDDAVRLQTALVVAKRNAHARDCVTVLGSCIRSCIGVEKREVGRAVTNGIAERNDVVPCALYDRRLFTELKRSLGASVGLVGVRLCLSL